MREPDGGGAHVQDDSSLFFTTAIIETETRGWPCFGPEEAALEQGSAAFDDLFGVGGGAAGDASSNASAAAIARGDGGVRERTGELRAPQRPVRVRVARGLSARRRRDADGL